MEKSESIKNIATALLNFHKLVGVIKKDSSNPFFKSKYAALPDILNSIDKPLLDSGLVVVQLPTGENGLTTMLIHSDSGEYIQDTYTMTPTKNDPQGLGSCITYQRRYALGAFLSLNIDEDDDGNGASQPKAEAKKEADDNKPWMNEDAFKKCIHRIMDGENGVVDKAKAAFKIKKEYIGNLLEAEKQAK